MAGDRAKPTEMEARPSAAETRSADTKATPAIAPELTSNALVHSPYRRATDLLQRLAPGKMRIGFFLGAGCPLAVRVPDGQTTKPLIPEIAGLTRLVKDHLDADKHLKDVAQMAWERVTARGFSSPTIEDVLSHIRTLISLCGEGSIDGFSKELLVKLDRTVCEKVREIVSVALPTSDTPYTNWD